VIEQQPVIERAIGVDIGGTRTKLVLLEAPGTVIEAREIGSDFATAEAVVEVITMETAVWRQLDEGTPPSLGLAVPGLVERDAGRVLSAPNLKVLDNFAIAIALEATTGLHVEVDNDAHTFGLAEAHLGAAAGYDSAVCLTVGTGVGGAIIHAGTVWRGHGGLAGELGHLVLDPEASQFFEQEVGGGAVVAEYRRLAENPTADVDAEVVARFADSGDNAARQALALCGRRLGVGLAILVNLLNPQRIVIGGGVVDAGEWFLGPARIEGERRAWAESWAQCEVVPAALGPMAGAIGAALLSLE
tara:strand:- start:314 stop:1219 length:906 start_codon:yes stop_codon:yes gene_type:complete